MISATKLRASLLSALVGLAALASATVRAEVLLERTALPLDAAPSSFAVGLPGGINVCFDPTRCAVSYVWQGGFLDLTTVRPGMGKLISPAKLLGPVVYRESGVSPLRRGDPTRAPVVMFKGYTLGPDAIEFRYLLDDVLVREEIRVAPGSARLTRRFRLEGATDASWWYVTAGQPARPLTVAPGGEIAHDVVLTAPAP